MSSRKEARAHKRTNLIQAAAEVFAERGYAGATIDEIARRAGVAKGTPYLHFEDKADLFYAVFESFTDEAVKNAEAALKDAKTAQERLLALVLGTADYVDSRREWFPLTMEIWAASNTPALRQRFAAVLQDLYARYRAQTAAIIRQGQAAAEIRPEVDAQALATILVGAMDGLFLQCWFDPALDPRRVAENFFDTLNQGLLIASSENRP